MDYRINNTQDGGSMEIAGMGHGSESPATLGDLISAAAAGFADSVAVIYEDQQLTYSELEHRSNQLAHHLQQTGVAPGTLAGVYIERSLDMLVALLGLLKAGAAYIPIDPAYPGERIRYMLEDSSAQFVLTQASLADSLPAYSGRVFCIDSDWHLVDEAPGDPVPQ